jgi:hypothetical protein
MRISSCWYETILCRGVLRQDTAGFKLLFGHQVVRVLLVVGALVSADLVLRSRGLYERLLSRRGLAHVLSVILVWRRRMVLAKRRLHLLVVLRRMPLLLHLLLMVLVVLNILLFCYLRRRLHLTLHQYIRIPSSLTELTLDHLVVLRHLRALERWVVRRDLLRLLLIRVWGVVVVLREAGLRGKLGHLHMVGLRGLEVRVGLSWGWTVDWLVQDLLTLPQRGLGHALLIFYLIDNREQTLIVPIILLTLMMVVRVRVGVLSRLLGCGLHLRWLVEFHSKHAGFIIVIIIVLVLLRILGLLNRLLLLDKPSLLPFPLIKRDRTLLFRGADTSPLLHL